MSEITKQQPSLKWEDGDEYEPEVRMRLQVPCSGNRAELTLSWWPEADPRPVMLVVSPVPQGSDGGWETCIDLSREDTKTLHAFLGMMLTLIP